MMNGLRLPTTSLRVLAQAKPAPISARTPNKLDVAAFTTPQAFDRWNAGVQAAGDVGANVISIYDVIGYDFWTGGGVTAKRIDAALRSIGAKDVEVHINSPGGDMFEGIAIYNRLLEHPGKITVKVFGLAASAASIIAMAGEERLIGSGAFVMIHNCWVLAAGNRHDMAEVAAFLEPFDDAMAGVYVDRTGAKKADVAKWMDAETWMSGGQAEERGFATGTLASDAMKDDAEASAKARDMNAVRQAEIALCRSGCTRAEARSLLNKIKGTPDAARDTPKPDAGDLSWLGAAAELTQAFRS
jgi:ATP-dependent protease ClpP protease subunit